MKVADMHTKSHKDLVKHADKLRTKIAELKGNIGVKEIKNIREIRHLRRELAATLTVARQTDKKE